jgi:ribosomal RNA assembly protein
MLFVKVPKERVGVLIGLEGKTKALIEESTGVTLQIDSAEGDVTIIPREDAKAEGLVGLAARDIVKAIARGFSPDRALALRDEDMYLTMMDIRDYVGKSQKHIKRVRGRLIGTNGKTRRIIEELSGAEMSVYGNSIALIGDLDSTDVSKRAVEMILEGSEHAAVYRFLEGQRRVMRFREMAME